jgi:Pectinacetylesterase
MKRRQPFQHYVLLLELLLLTGSITSCVQKQAALEPTPEPMPELSQEQDYLSTLQKLGFGKHLTETQFHPQHTKNGAWDVYTYPLDELRCVLGGEYFIQTRKGSESKKTVIWMDGGGPCFPGRDACVKDAQIHSWIESYGLASSEPDNPVKNWNIVYIPYCNGSSYMGDADADYDGDGEVDHWHWGQKSIAAAMYLMEEQFPDTEKILIAGCSAGGGGTIFTAPIARLAFPNADIYVLNISGLGLVKAGEDELRALIKSTWGMNSFIPPDCELCDEQIIHMYAWLLERDPKLKIGLYSSYHDHALVENWEMSPGMVKSLLLTNTEAIRTDHADSFKRFFISGDRHCMDNYFYEVGGDSFWEWIGYLVTESPRWMDLLEKE